MSTSFLDAASRRSRDAKAARLAAGPRRPTAAAGGSSSCAHGACAAAAPTYEPLHPELFEAEFRDEWLAESFAAALRDGSEAALRGVLCHEVPDRVVSFEMFRPSFCEALLDELLRYEASGMPVARPNSMSPNPNHNPNPNLNEASGMPVARPNSMNAYGVIVNQIGMRPLIDDLQRRHLLPLTRLLFPEEGGAFTSHHSFMVRYKQGEDLGLDMHHDDSDVTLNVCLGREFTGATLP